MMIKQVQSTKEKEKLATFPLYFSLEILIMVKTFFNLKKREKRKLGFFLMGLKSTSRTPFSKSTLFWTQNGYYQEILKVENLT